MPFALAPVLWVGGAFGVGYSLGMFSDTSKIVKLGLLAGGGYIIYSKVAK